MNEFLEQFWLLDFISLDQIFDDDGILQIFEILNRIFDVRHFESLRESAPNKVIRGIDCLSQLSAYILASLKIKGLILKET